MQKARQIIETANARRPVVMLSGGKDSLLVLLLVLEQIKPDVIWYRTGSQEQRWAIEQWTMKHDLTVYSHEPRDIYYLPMGHSPALVREYDINGDGFPVVAETIEGERCGLQVGEQRSERFLFPWDVTFTGWKDSDTHELTDGKVPYAPNGTVIGGSKFYAPIRHMVDEEVREHLKTLAPEFEDFDDSLPLCTRCFSGNDAEVFCPMEQANIPTFQWDRQASLDAFRQRVFGLVGG